MEGLAGGLHQGSVVHHGHAAPLTQRFQLRTDERSNASPRALGIKVAWFIMEWQLVFECMVAEQLSWCLEEGANHLNTATQVPTIAHAPEALGSCASNQRQEDGFHLVIGVVTQQHMGKVLFSRNGVERVVASASCGGRIDRRLQILSVVGNVTGFAPRTHGHQFVLCFGTQVVLYRDGMQCPRGAVYRSMGQIKQGKRIWPARDRDQPSPICSPQSPHAGFKIPQQGDSTRFVIRFGQG